MSETIDVTGSCLCGAVQVHALAMSPNVGVCHCDNCRKWAGGPLLAVDCKNTVKFTGEDKVSTYASSEWAERGFCSECGTHLFYKLIGNGQYIIPVGIFGKQPSLKLDHQIFIDQKPEYYTFSNETKNMTGAEVFAQFAGG